MQTLREAQEKLNVRRDGVQEKTNILKTQFAGNVPRRRMHSNWFRRKAPIPYYPLPVFSSMDLTGQMNVVNEAFAQLRLGRAAFFEMASTAPDMALGQVLLNGITGKWGTSPQPSNCWNAP